MDPTILHPRRRLTTDGLGNLISLTRVNINPGPSAPTRDRLVADSEANVTDSAVLAATRALRRAEDSAQPADELRGTAVWCARDVRLAPVRAKTVRTPYVRRGWRTGAEDRLALPSWRQRAVVDPT